MKTCTKCLLEKPESHFHKHKNKTREQCKSCRNAYLKSWTKSNPNKRKNQKLKHLYGLTLEQYQDILKKQDGVCAICKQTHWKMVVDHCHSSGKVRGILCHKCNYGLGAFSDRADLIQTAYRYLISN